MDDSELGELKDVDVREVWDHEAYNFTPWLAKNLDRLSAVLDVDLELEDTEKYVGPYRADIVCRVPADGTVVLIENQLEHADLQHLGQVLAYLAGLEAKIVVWIARGFGDAHLSALRWLNEHTPEQFAFFAVRVRVVRIEDSRRAPVFEVIERPNEWLRPSSLSELGRFRRNFWQHLAERHPDAPRLSPGFAASNAYHTELPSVNMRICQYIASDHVGVYLSDGRGESDEDMLTRLKPHLPSLRDALGAASKEDRLGRLSEDYFRDDELANYPCLVTLSVKTKDTDNWDRMADWLDDRRRLFERVLGGDPGRRE